MKKILLLFILCVALGVGGWFFWNHRTQEEQPVAFYGNVDIREVQLGFRVGGRVLEVCKEEGDTVHAGDVLARIDPVTHKDTVAVAKAQVQQLQAQLAELENGSRAEEIQQAQSSLAAAQATLDHDQKLFARHRILLDSQAVSKERFDAARSAYLASKAKVTSARAALQLAQIGPRPEQKNQVRAALAGAKAHLSQAQTALDDTVLIAPENGTVLTRIIEPGSMLNPGSPALTVSLRSPVRIRAYAPEKELGQLQPGRAVLIYTNSRKTPYNATIGDVSPRAEFTPKTVETEELRTALVYRFRAVITTPDAALRQGMPVTVRFSEQGDS